MAAQRGGAQVAGGLLASPGESFAPRPGEGRRRPGRLPGWGRRWERGGAGPGRGAGRCGGCGGAGGRSAAPLPRAGAPSPAGERCASCGAARSLIAAGGRSGVCSAPRRSFSPERYFWGDLGSVIFSTVYRATSDNFENRVTISTRLFSSRVTE